MRARTVFLQKSCPNFALKNLTRYTIGRTNPAIYFSPSNFPMSYKAKVASNPSPAAAPATCKLQSEPLRSLIFLNYSAAGGNQERCGWSNRPVDPSIHRETVLAVASITTPWWQRNASNFATVFATATRDTCTRKHHPTTSSSLAKVLLFWEGNELEESRPLPGQLFLTLLLVPCSPDDYGIVASPCNLITFDPVVLTRTNVCRSQLSDFGRFLLRIRWSIVFHLFSRLAFALSISRF